MMSLRDLMNAWRSLAKARIYVVSIVITLGITLGALIAMFNLNYQLLAKPLPYPDQERLFLLAGNLLSDNKVDESNVYSYPSMMAAYKESDKYFEKKALVLFDRNVIRSLPDVPQVNIAYVTPEYLDLAAVTMAKGRQFSIAEGLDAHASVAIISYEAWADLYQRDPRILEKQIRFGDVDFNIIGVTAKAFSEPQLVMPGRVTQVWLPWDFNQVPSKFRATWEWFDSDRYLVGKLNIGMQPEQVAQSITIHLERRFREEVVGNTYWQDKSLLFDLKTFQQVILGDNKARLLLMLAGAFALVLIAIANIANLLLARAASQQRSMAIRAALGAQPRHLFNQVLAEVLWLMILSLIVGLIVALGLIAGLKSVAQQQLPRVSELYLDWSGIIFSILFTFLLAVGFAVLVSRQMNYRALNGQLQSGGKGVAIQISPRVRRMLMISQSMIGGLLLTFGVLILKTSLLNISQPTGMLAENLVRIFLNEGAKSEASTEERQSAYKAIFKELVINNKVVGAAFASEVPLSGDTSPLDCSLSKNISLLPQLSTRCFIVDEHYLPMLGFRWIQGRNFTQEEMQAGAPVMVVNQTLARRLEGDGDGQVMGRRFFWANGRKDKAYEIIGVVADLTPPGAQEEPRMFFPGMYRTPLILLQLKPGQELTNTEINNLLAKVDSQYKVASQLSMTKAHELLIAQDKLAALVAAALAIMALGLVAIGLYGIVSYSLQLRQFELGVRMAIGATPPQLLMRLLIDNLGPVIAGLLLVPMTLAALMIWFKPAVYTFEISVIDWILPWLLILLVVVLITLAKTSKIVNQPASNVLRNS